MKKLREHLDVQPFKPIVVRTVSGARHTINHPEYLLIPPIGDTFLVVDADGTMHHIDISYVEAVETLPKSRKSLSK